MASPLSKIIFLLSLSSFIFVSSAQNNDLVQKICTKALNHPFCFDFFKSDRHVSNLQTLGLKAFDAAKASAGVANNLIVSLEKKTTDPALKEKYRSCLENYGDAISNLGEARNSFKDPGSMNIKVSAVMTDVDTCNDEFNGNPNGPANLKNENQRLTNICSIILAISNLL